MRQFLILLIFFYNCSSNSEDRNAIAIIKQDSIQHAIDSTMSSLVNSDGGVRSKLYANIPKFRKLSKEEIDHYLDEFAHFNRDKYSDDILDLQEEVILFVMVSAILNGHLKTPNSSMNRAELLQIRDRLKKLQETEFPIMRQKYAENLKRTFWIDDIEVRSYGKNNEKVGFYSSRFYTNRNIKEFLDGLEKPINMLRFEYMFFAPYRKGDGQRFYSNAPKDSSVLDYYYY